jgi:hypothetical protein
MHAQLLKTVTLSIGTPLCPYGVAYRRAHGLSFGRTVPFSEVAAVSSTVGTTENRGQVFRLSHFPQGTRLKSFLLEELKAFVACR